MQAELPNSPVFDGLLFSAAIRIFFHPAREAANLGPIEALHFE